MMLFEVNYIKNHFPLRIFCRGFEVYNGKIPVTVKNKWIRNFVWLFEIEIFNKGQKPNNMNFEVSGGNSVRAK